MAREGNGAKWRDVSQAFLQEIVESKCSADNIKNQCRHYFCCRDKDADAGKAYQPAEKNFPYAAKTVFDGQSAAGNGRLHDDSPNGNNIARSLPRQSKKTSRVRRRGRGIWVRTRQAAVSFSYQTFSPRPIQATTPARTTRPTTRKITHLGGPFLSGGAEPGFWSVIKDIRFSCRRYYSPNFAMSTGILYSKSNESLWPFGKREIHSRSDFLNDRVFVFSTTLIAIPFPMYELKTETFSGPLEKLLELIEAHEMDVSTVSMAQVTDDFLKYLDALRKKTVVNSIAGDVSVVGEEKIAGAFNIDLRILADFISVASKLIFLKSKYLLPGIALSEEDEADINDLEGRLKTYQQLRPALRHVAKLWRESHRSYSRPYLMGRNSAQGIFYPGKTLDVSGLFYSLNKIFETMKTYELETDIIREKIVTLEEKISQVLERIQKEGDMHFRHLSGEQSRGETIIAFLAILHLAREQIVLLEQMEQFSDIMVKNNTAR